MLRNVDSSPKKPHNNRVNKARIASSNKTGIVFKISLVFFILLGLLVYKLNDYFKADKVEAMQGQVRNRVVSIKTTVSGQLAQLKNVLSGYENEISDVSVNWVQLDPFFAVARVQNDGGQFQVLQMSVRSNTPAERWNADYLARALKINRAKQRDDIAVQLFKDRDNNKFVLLRFKTSGNQEIVVAGAADYFQKYFDIERGSRNKSLLITNENILAAHTEASYIANSSKEAKLSANKYIIEKEEIAGTNLQAVSYILRSRVTSGLAVPWSIVGVVVGVCFVLIGIIYWSLDPIERRVERYRKQEREQIYKDTMQNSLQALAADGSAVNNRADSAAGESAEPTDFEEASKVNAATPQAAKSDFESSTFEVTKTAPIFKTESSPASGTDANRIELDESDADEEQLSRFSVAAGTQSADTSDAAGGSDDLYNLLESAIPVKNQDSKNVANPSSSDNGYSDRFSNAQEEIEVKVSEESFLTLDEEKIDLDEIEKALALDDFEEQDKIGNVHEEALKQNLRPQKISVDAATSPIDRPQFSLNKKEFQVDEVKVFVRRPERS